MLIRKLLFENRPTISRDFRTSAYFRHTSAILLPYLCHTRCTCSSPYQPLPVQPNLLLRKPDVQSPLVRVQPRVLHRQHIRVLCGLVMVTVPPSGGGDEHGSRLPYRPAHTHIGNLVFIFAHIHIRLQQRIAGGTPSRNARQVPDTVMNEMILPLLFLLIINASF